MFSGTQTYKKKYIINTESTFIVKIPGRKIAILVYCIIKK